MTLTAKTASRLSDFYEARGDILRRMGKLQEAEASYRIGANIEDEYRLDAT
jgi:predicted RNA polymerase sigma factor